MPQNENLVDKLVTRLPQSSRSLFHQLRAQARALGLDAFLVGGTVRDLLLDRESLDVDIVIEGDAVSLARQIAETTGVRLAKTTAFGTATLKNEGLSLDLATARAETYAKPGALPKVRPSTIEEDLGRRDFTINAMAVQITRRSTGRFLDPVGGWVDLHRGRVRVLNDGSFQDDATRILRAVRYEQRFGFSIEELTLSLLHRDLRFIDTISGTRIRQELSRTFAEAEPERALGRLHDLGVLSKIHPALAFNAQQAEATCRLRTMGAPSLAVWPVFAWGAVSAPDLASRLALTRPQAEAIAAVPDAMNVLDRVSDSTRASGIAQLLDPLPIATTFALGAMTNNPRIIEYLSTMRILRPALRGDDLIGIGVPRGPDVSLVLSMLRAARLDGEVSSRADEEALVEQFLARERIGLA